jgi:type I restriction enzyme, S subunit
MGKYQGYEKYKESGVEWLGAIPEHWEAKRLKQLTKLIDGDRGKNYPNESDLEDDGIPFLSTDNIKSNVFVFSQRTKFITVEKFESLSRGKLVKNDLVVTMRGTIGQTALFSDVPYETAFINAQMIIVRPTNISADFLKYISMSALWSKQLDFYSYGTAQQQLSGAILGILCLSLPPLDEQESIAHFLDRKTSQIDILIAKKSALLEKLDEKRTALISHAVTKGLDSSVPMKNSGVEWLGDIPEHWDFLPMKRFSEIYDCKHKTVSFVDDGLPVASIAQVQNFYIDLSTAHKTTEDEFVKMLEGGRKPRNGDIIFSRNATVGASAIVRDDTFCMGQDVCLIRPIKTNSVFLNYNFYSFFVKTQIDNCLLGSTFKRINVEKVKNLIICLPSLAEQEKITSFIIDRTAEIDRQKAKVKEAIELLKEYRTALITNAVTGKIDVRQVASI